MGPTLRLILWPSILTLAVSLLRVTLEVQGIVNHQSGGGLTPLGITWLAFVFGAFFGWKLRRAGSRPWLRHAAVWSLLPMVALITAVAIGFGGIDRADQSEAAYEALRGTANVIAIIAIAGAALCFVIWRRLALTMLLYALAARIPILVITFVAKNQGWNTHYTKFGPAGIEVGPGETMYATTIAQLGFWVPFTIAGGMLAGTIASRFSRSD